MTRLHGTLAMAAATLGGAAAVTDLRTGVDVTQLAAEIDRGRDHISALDLGERMMRGEGGLRVLDLRSAIEFAQFHIPGAQLISIRALAQEALPRDATIVLYSEGGAHAAQAWVLLRLRGYRKVVVLREGVYEWISRVFEPRLAIDATAIERADYERANILSRYFGGIPRAGVPRTELPVGYWTGAPHENQPVGTARRRGC